MNIIQLANSVVEKRFWVTVESLLIQYQNLRFIHGYTRRLLAPDSQLNDDQVEQICQVLNRMQVIASVLRLLASRMEQEIEETTDQLHTWYYD